MAVGTTGTIPARTIVDVHSRLITPGGTDLAFNGVLIDVNPSVPIKNDVLIFNSRGTVGSYFGLDSLEYEAAQIYFNGYNNAPIRPRALVIARRIEEDESGYLMTGRIDLSLNQVIALGGVGFMLTINNVQHEIVASFASITSFSQAGELLADAITNAFSGDAFWPSGGEVTMRYYSHIKEYVIQLPGSGLTVEYAGPPVPQEGITDISSLFCMTAATGAYLGQPVEAMTINETMAMIQGVTTNWVSFTSSEEPSIADMESYGKWSTNQEEGYQYVPWTISASALINGSTNDPATVLEQANITATSRPLFGGLEYAMFLMGAIGSIDWNRENAMVTLAFKAQAGLPANVTSEDDYNVLVEQKNYNIYGTWATRNDKFTWMYPGSQFGDFKFIDAWLGMVYLMNAIQVSLMNGLEQTGRLNYTDEGGFSRVNTWISSVFTKGRSNGTVDRGVRLSDEQKSQIIEEAGMDITQELYLNGYYVQVLDPGAVARYERESPIVNAWYTYGGSIHKINVPVSALL